jgi:hypothetical protein
LNEAPNATVPLSLIDGPNMLVNGWVASSGVWPVIDNNLYS